MKCPQCSVSHKVKEGMKCKKCSYSFAFNPKDPESSKLTDTKFLAAIRLAGQNDTAHFTKNQLYAAYAQQQKVKRIPGFIVATVSGCGGLFALFIGAWIFFILFWLFAVVVLLSSVFSKPVVLSHKQFMTMVARWLRHGKSIEGLIRHPSLATPPPEWKESDIYDYGVQRLLIVQRDELVDLLVLNNLHAEQSALVLSASGYPKYLIPRATKLLTQQPELPVFLLHDADTDAKSVLGKAKNIGLPIEKHPVTDMGMSPDDFRRLDRTKQFDRDRTRRDLPVDALLTPFLAVGLGACFANGVTMSALIEEHARQAAVDSTSSSFG